MKRRRSNTACPMRKSNRTYKRQDRRRLFRTVRKFSPVEAPQVGTYHGAQDDLSIDPIKNPISIKKAKVTETPRIATFNCKGSNHISGREKIAHRMKTHNLYRYFILKKTHTNKNTEEIHENYYFVFSTPVTDQQREDANQAKEEADRKKGKGKQNGRIILSYTT